MTEKRKKIIIYAIDTTGPFCSVSLLIDQGKEGSISIYEEQSKNRISHVQEMLPLTKKLMEKADIKVKDIDVIGVSKGPGSYTGIRAGVSMTRAMGQILNKPLVGVSSLEAFALIKEDCYLVCPIFNARRGQIYGGAYVGVSENFTAEERVIIKGEPYMLDEFLKLLENIENKEERKIIFYGDGVEAYESQLLEFKTTMEKKGSVVIVDEKELHQRASAVALRAYEIFLGEGGKLYQEILPDYMRKVEAEQKLEEKKKKIREEIILRQVLAEDVPELAQVEKKCFKDPWSEQMYREEIVKNKLSIYVCAEYEGNIIGYGGLWIIGNEGHITNVAVDPQYRKGGIGYEVAMELMRVSEKKAGQELNFTLEVRESNEEAQKLYEKLSFKKAGKRPKYYGKEDAIIMWRINNNG